MSLGAISHQFLQQVEALTGLPVRVEPDERLQPPLLARVQVARRGVPLHRVSYHPSARAMADYLIAFQCSFVLRLYALPPAERFELTDAPGTQPDPLDWVRAHPASAQLPADRQAAFADFLRTSLMSMLRSMPAGIWVDHDLRTRFPELREPQEQALRRQIDTHAALFRAEVQRSVPEHPWRLSLAMNAAFAKFWGQELGQPGWMLPYHAAGIAQRGETLLAHLKSLPPLPVNDRPLIDAWASDLGLANWLQWVPHAP
ncbi:MAG: hypothetical protein WCR07_01070 [Verrucomicrobiota bacterium]|jgi:hypothetical protein